MKQMTVLGRPDTTKGLQKMTDSIDCNLFIQIRIEIIAYNLSM